MERGRRIVANRCVPIGSFRQTQSIRTGGPKQSPGTDPGEGGEGTQSRGVARKSSLHNLASLRLCVRCPRIVRDEIWLPPSSLSSPRIAAQPPRPRYSPVRVSTRAMTPASRCSGTWITWPVERVAGLVRPVAELPRTPGAVSVIGSSTAVRDLDADRLVVDDQCLDPVHVLGHERCLLFQVNAREHELIKAPGVHEVELVLVSVEELDRTTLETRLVLSRRSPCRSCRPAAAT